MREIKFRAWSDNKTMSYDIQDTTDGISHTISFGSWLHNKRHIIMQYTGLKDKNGVDGYHKDICLYKDDSNTLQKGVIEWRDSGASFYLKAIGGDDEGNQDGYMEDGEFEVIGNIYENPELIEKAG